MNCKDCIHYTDIVPHPDKYPRLHKCSYKAQDDCYQMVTPDSYICHAFKPKDDCWEEVAK